MTEFPGKTSEDNQKFELDYWEKYGGVEKFDIHLPIYQSVFPLYALDYQRESILDVGSGAISVFDKLAPKEAKVLPFDILADEYNRIAPDKKFIIQNQIPPNSAFSLITLFNMIDHVDDPDDLLVFIRRYLAKDGRVWIATHLDQTHGKLGHPQKFSYQSIVALFQRHFSIESCGIVQEGIPTPYLWYGVLRPTEISGLSAWCCVFQGGLQYYNLHLIRILAKAVKLVGLRSLLKKRWQF